MKLGSELVNAVKLQSTFSLFFSLHKFVNISLVPAMGKKLITNKVEQPN